MDQAKLNTFLEKMRQFPVFEEMPSITLNSRDYCGDLPIHYTAIWGDIEGLALLVEAGSDIDARGEFDSTPLHYAIEQEKVTAARWLVAPQHL